MKRVFAHIGFSFALTLFVLNFFSKELALIAFGVLISLTVFSLALKKVRQAMAAPICFGSAALACLLFVITISGTYQSTVNLNCVTAPTTFVIESKNQSSSTYSYIIKTKEINAPSAPQNIKVKLKSDKELNFGYNDILASNLTFSSDYNNGYDSAGTYGDRIFVSAKADAVTAVGIKNFSFNYYVQTIKEKITDIFKNALIGQNGALANALITGDKQSLSTNTESAFYDCGASHLMAVSGLHLSVIALSIYLLMKKLFVPKIPRTIISLAVLWGYCGVSGFSPSVVRASIMMSIMLIAELLGRKADGINSLGFSAFLLCLNPFAVTDVSFLLSVTSVLSLMTLAPIIKKWLVRLTGLKQTNYIINGVCVSLSVMIYTLPVLWFVYGSMAITGVMTNLVLIPIGQFTIISGLLLIIFSKLGFIGYFFGLLTGTGTSLMIGFADGVSKLNIPVLSLSTGLTGIAISGVFFIFSIAFIMKNKKLIRISAFICSALFIFCSVFGNYFDSQKTFVRVSRGQSGCCVFVYDKDNAIVIGNAAKDDYFVISSKIKEFNLNIPMIFCIGNASYFNALISQCAKTDNFVASNTDDELQTMVNSTNVLQKSEFSVDLCDGVNVQYTKLHKTEIVLVTVKDKIIEISSGEFQSYSSDIFVSYNNKNINNSLATYSIRCKGLNGEAVLFEIINNREVIARRENIWL